MAPVDSSHNPAEQSARLQLLTTANAPLHLLREPFARTETETPPPPPQPTFEEKPSESDPVPQPPPIFAPNFTLYTNVAHAILRHEVAAAARVWLLLRCLDHDRCGWITVEEARYHLTSKQSPHRVFGWRQLRNLLRAGQDTFWQRDKQRIWLRSTAKVAKKLEVSRLRKQPIVIPTNILFGKIQGVRAELFALMHHGRDERLISRAKLQEITSVNERTQRRYDHVAKIKKKVSYCIEVASKKSHDAAWHHRHAAFDFTDRQGKQGEAGAKYYAYQLPNSYSVNYLSAAKGRTRKINQQLREDLVENRAQGNNRDEGENVCAVERVEDRPKFTQLFFEGGKKASRAKGERYLKLTDKSRYSFWTYITD
ncbi:MAG: hypothetical protein ACPG8W_00005 [Candidatus Promineifilaceae bacterium]